MSVELIRDIINYERLIGEGTSQAMVNGDMVIPDRNPEIGKILNVDGRALIVSYDVVEDRIIAEGKMIFDILYASLDGGIYKMNAASTFNQGIQVPGALDKMLSRVSCEVEHIEYDLVSSKRIKVNAVINMKGIVYDRDKVDIITDIKGQDIQILRDTSNIDEFISEGNVQTIIKGRIESPDDKGEMKSVLKNDVHVHKKDVEVIEDKIVVNACALVKMLYETQNNEMCYVEQDIPFTSEINMPGIKDGMKCDVSFKVEDVYEDIKDNEAGERKAVEIEVVIDTYGNVYEHRDFMNLIDAYSPVEKYEFNREGIKVLNFYGEGTDSQAIKENIAVPQDMPRIANIKHISTNPIITEIKMLEEKILVEGVVNCCVMYAAASEDGGVESFEEELPFKSAISMPGVKIDMMPDVKCRIENVQYEKSSEKEIDIRIMVECTGKVYSKYMLDVVKNVEEMELPDNAYNMPSIIIYPVQQQDTLWKIAKKYYTTIDDIVALNELEDAENIKPGTKLLIPKKSFMK